MSAKGDRRPAGKVRAAARPSCQLASNRLTCPAPAADIRGLNDNSQQEGLRSGGASFESQSLPQITCQQSTTILGRGLRRPLLFDPGATKRSQLFHLENLHFDWTLSLTSCPVGARVRDCREQDFSSCFEALSNFSAEWKVGTNNHQAAPIINKPAPRDRRQPLGGRGRRRGHRPRPEVSRGHRAHLNFALAPRPEVRSDDTLTAALRPPRIVEPHSVETVQAPSQADPQAGGPPDNGAVCTRRCGNGKTVLVRWLG